MKKNIVIFLILLFLSNCSSPINNDYTGYIYYKDKPLKRVEIIEQNSINHTYTNEKGYFYLKRSNLHAVNNLILLQNGEKDTIELLRGGAAGSNTYYLFLNERIDTLDLYREKSFNQ